MNNIGKARKTAGFSQKEVAITIGVSRPTVSQWESGKKNPTGKNLLELAKLLSCSVDYLLDNDNPAPPNAKKAPESPIDKEIQGLGERIRKQAERNYPDNQEMQYEKVKEKLSAVETLLNIDKE